MDAMSEQNSLKIGLPKGSLQEATLDKMAKALLPKLEGGATGSASACATLATDAADLL